MVPARIVLLDALPLTPNGKIDRGALPDVPLSEPQPVGAPARSPLEHEVARVWAEVLGRDAAAVPADVAFADLGGHSLLAASVLGRLARDTGRRLALPQFPVGATIRDLAATLRDVAPSDEGAVRRGPSGSGRVYPTAPIQVEFWVIDHVTEGRSATCVMPVLLRVEGALDMAVLRQALELMPTRHEVLRTAIREQEGRLVARIEEPRPVPLEVVSDRAALDELARQPIDIQSGQLLAAAVFNGGDGTHSLLLRVHHAAGDGWSIGLLVRDLSEVYAALASGRAPSPGPGLQFADCATWLDEARHREHARLSAYWRTRLADLGEEQSLPPTRRSGVAADHGRPGSRITRALDSALVDRVREFARTHRVTEYAVLLAATAVRIHRETGNTDVALRVPVSNRRRPEFETVVGPFLETAIARVDVSGDPTFAELASARGAAPVAEDVDNSWIESVHMIEQSGVARHSGGKPVSQVLVAVQNYPAAVHTAGGLRWVYVNELDNGGAKTDLGCFWELDVADGPLLNVEYDTNLHTRAGAHRLAAQLERLVEDAIAATGPTGERALAWVDDVDLAVIAGSTTGSRSGPAVATPTEITRQAARTPGAIAVDCPHTGQVSYADLQRRALIIAARASRARPAGPARLRWPSPAAGRPRGSPPCWACGTPAGRTCRSTPATRWPGCATSWTTAGRWPIVADDSCPADLAPAWRSSTPTARRAIRLRAPLDPDLDAPSYFIYTSGSTGRPKGVRISHGALAASLQSMDEVVPLSGTDIVAAVATPIVRHLLPGDVAAPAARCPDRRGHRGLRTRRVRPRPPDRRARRHPRPAHPVGLAPPRRRRMAGDAQVPGAGRRRAGPSDSGRRAARSLRRGLERLRPHRGDDLVLRPPHQRGGHPRVDRARRNPARQHPPVRPRPRRAVGPGRHHRPDPRRGQLARRRLPPPRGVDACRVHARHVAARDAPHLQHRRPGRAARGRAAGVPGPGRQPGQGARRAHRARGGRRDPACRAGSGPGDDPRPARRARRRSARRLRGPRRRVPDGPGHA